MIEQLLEDNNYDVDQVVMHMTDSNLSIGDKVKSKKAKRFGFVLFFIFMFFFIMKIFLNVL